MIRWVAVASVALHVAVLFVLPDPPARPVVLSPISVVDLAEEPTRERPPPDPQPAPPEPPAAMTNVPIARTTALSAPRGAPSPADRPDAPPLEAPLDDAPADFTGMTISNAGAVAAAPAGGSTDPVPSARPATATKRAAAPRFVAAASLARPPRAPDLDSALERSYPPDARRAGISGKAVLRVRILPDGRVAGVERVSESYPGFADACERTVRAAQWEPPIDSDGQPVATEISYACRFEVRS